MISARRAIIVIAVLSVLAAASACGKGGGSSGSPDAFKSFDMEARKQAWQGAWALPYSMDMTAGGWSAVQIDGAKALVNTGSGADIEMKVSYEAPCSLALENKKADGTTETWNVGYVLANGQIWAGLGGAGAVKGKEAIACDHPWGVYALGADGKCKLWKQEMMRDDAWKSEPAECGFRKAKPGTDVSWITDDPSNPEIFAWKPPVGDREESLKQIDDALIDEQLFSEHGEKAADFAAAKALVATKNTK